MNRRCRVVLSGLAGVLLAFAVGSGALAGNSESRHAVATPPGRIVYAGNQHDKSQPWEIWTMNASGGDVRRLTSNRVTDRAPKWSPDGRRILFLREAGGRLDLMVMNWKGGDVRTIARRVFSDGEWNANGGAVAFRGPGGLTVMEVSGANRRVLRTPKGSPIIADPLDWSPDGDEIAIAGGNPDDEDPNNPVPRRVVSAVHLKTGAIRSMDGVDGNGFQWSPDGRWIVYVDNRSLAKGLTVARANGAGATVILQNRRKAPIISPSWSPNGTRIVYSRGAWPRERQEIAVIERNGDNERLLTTNDRDDVDPDWGRG